MFSRGILLNSPDQFWRQVDRGSYEFCSHRREEDRPCAVSERDSAKRWGEKSRVRSNADSWILPYSISTQSELIAEEEKVCESHETNVFFFERFCTLPSSWSRVPRVGPRRCLVAFLTLPGICVQGWQMISGGYSNPGWNARLEVELPQWY